MAVSTIKKLAVKTATTTGTPSQYGTLRFSSEAEAVADRITGIINVNKAKAVVNITVISGVPYFVVYNVTTGTVFQEDLTITVGYI